MAFLCLEFDLTESKEVCEVSLIFGVGINDADYSVIVRKEQPSSGKKRVRNVIFKCPYYFKWHDMLRRCYSKTSLTTRPNYAKCSVCKEWLLFSNFKAWMETQNWEGNQLDKDLLIKSNKVYSPQACCFVTTEVNNFILEQASKRGEFKIGVHRHTVNQTFITQINVENKRTYLGSFNTEEEAHEAWLTEKLKLAKILANKQTDPRVARALIERYEV